MMPLVWAQADHKTSLYTINNLSESQNLNAIKRRFSPNVPVKHNVLSGIMDIDLFIIDNHKGYKNGIDDIVLRDSRLLPKL